MKQTYTEKKLIRFIYKECDLFEQLEMEDALNHDLGLQEDFRNLSAAKSKLPKVSFQPSDLAISNILSYSENMLAHC